MATTQNKPIIKVIETREVKYKKHNFFFFYWYQFLSATSLDKTIHIFSNDENIKQVYFNGNLLTLPSKHIN